MVALDVTNPAAVSWFVARLKTLQARYGIDGRVGTFHRVLLFAVRLVQLVSATRSYRSSLPLTHSFQYVGRLKRRDAKACSQNTS